MISNTASRILSSIALVLLLGLVFFAGKSVFLCFLLVGMIIILDEIFENFLNIKRSSWKYIFAQISVLIPYIFIFFIPFDSRRDLVGVFVHLGILNNVFLLIYLFLVPLNDLTLVQRAKRRPYLIGLFFLPIVVSLGAILKFELWERYILALLVINSGMDTGGWFFGKYFGSHKLWPQISPKKTVEGLIGGILTSASLGSLFWHFFIYPVNYVHFLIFAFFGFLSQLGDLVQSKLKRQFGIKDSSGLIPGHGGLYDRADSLIFLAPFFVAALRYMKGYYLL